MTFHFGDFELDEQQLELRLKGKALELQPLVFQLLLYLVRHRDRVVPKNELLETIWADSVVTESSLQRAVSLARTALRKGGMQGALKNFPRAGYRFMAELDSSNPAAPALELAEAQELERLADEHKWAGKLADAVPLLERAIAAYRQGGDRAAAVRVMIRLARIQQERLETAASKGWLAVAGNVLRDLPESREHGLLEWMLGELCIGDEDAHGAIKHCDLAHDIARRVHDPDLEALARATRGHGLMGSGRQAEAAECHQEAVALVLAGGVSAEHGGYVMCSVITSAVNRGDWISARQWTDQFVRWCGRFGKSTYPGLCQLHRAEMLHFNGNVPRALEEAETALRVLKSAAPWAEGDVWRVLGDIHYAKGDHAKSAQAYQRAYTMGWDPQPGLAWIQFADGNTDAAIGGLKRSIASSNWFARERRMLLQAELVGIAAAAGQPKLAKQTLADLEEAPDLGLPMQRALRARARARIAACEGNHALALEHIAEARRYWLTLGATLDAGLEHMEAARVLRESGDPVGAELELTAAGEVFQKAGATGLQARCEQLRKHRRKT
ncbi:MAG: winged helix-turn-helix domain-containing protein [Planctomycetes bacterium]|nr:winged helix-turn-helix domain-containing protein [Planctomycetota bacterium]